MCVMLAPELEDQQKLKDLTLRFAAADSWLGSEVAFILLDPKGDSAVGLDRGMGEVGAFSGAAFPLRDTTGFRDLTDDWAKHRDRVAQISARGLARFVPEFMEIFKVTPKDLPCLSLVVHGVDESIVLSLGKDWTVEELKELLMNIRTIVDGTPNFREQISAMAAQLPKPLERLQDLVNSIGAKAGQTSKILDQMLRRHNGNEDDHRIVASYVGQGCQGRVILENVLMRFSFKDSERFLRDEQTARLLKLATQLDSLRAPLIELQHGGLFIPSVTELAQHWVASRDKLFEGLQGLLPAKQVTTTRINRNQLTRLKSVLEFVNTSGDVVGKAVAAYDWIIKLTGKGS
ncbi:hypothetical protein PsexTeo8_30140 [Pseudomonas extremaustralis]|uniref:hypothetical protein n=1 Tax=Pseudomonas extremaustralis TaxID=359110 RepID=UPI002AA0C541|nr:hypothetical protein [Pseudomonas extremaustralis]MDY7066555.1 hypothetical protein [Pseudomonas extremaustralis]